MRNDVKQILLGSALGDGHISKAGNFSTGSKYYEWVKYKADILKDYISDNWYKFLPENGYSQTPYHKMATKVHKDIKEIYNMSLQEKLYELDELGFAVWLYDDGSLHKRNYFYNLNTHSFTKEEHIRFIIPALYRFGIHADLLSETKKDGRKFYYTYIPKYRGAQIVNRILHKIPLKCYSYKRVDFNINDLPTNYRPIKTVSTLTGKINIYKGKYEVIKELGLTTFEVTKAIKTRKPIKNYLISIYRFE